MSARADPMRFLFFLLFPSLFYLFPDVAADVRRRISSVADRSASSCRRLQTPLRPHLLAHDPVTLRLARSKPDRATLRVRRVRPESEFRLYSVGPTTAMNGPPPRFSACPRVQSFARKFLSELSRKERNRPRSGSASLTCFLSRKRAKKPCARSSASSGLWPWRQTKA